MSQSSQKFKISVLFLSLHLISSLATASFLTEYVNENIYNPAKDEKLSVRANLGFGNQNNYQLVNSYSLDTTNRNFALLGVDINGKFDATINVPVKDTAEARAQRVDSNVQSYSLSYRLSDQYKLVGRYSMNEGYYHSDLLGKIYTLPNFGFNHSSVTLYYLTEPKHRSTFLDPMIYEKKEDSGSWIFGAGLAHSEMNGLQDLNTLPVFRKTDLKSASAESLLLHVSYSKNWFWSKWFATLSGGFLQNFGYYKKNYVTADSSNEGRGRLGFNLGMSVGMVEQYWLAGAFSNVSSIASQIDNLDMSSQIGVGGIYVGMQF